MGSVTPELIAGLRALAQPGDVFDEGEMLETLSKDFFWYSPVLRRQLADKRADVVVRPGNLAVTRAVLAACARAQVPVVPRGAGTGNYGQCVPLHGGVVLDLSRCDRILAITDDGVLRVEPGARLGVIEIEARRHGWELRCLPSTWVKSTMAGFFCGGSGGIGSITWGGINAPGNVKSVTMMTCEVEPRTVRLEEADALKALHTYGTTGVMVEIEMRLAPKVNYEELMLTSPDWFRLLDWTDEIARRTEWRKRLVTQFEAPIPQYFKPIIRHLPAGEHATFVMVDHTQADAVAASAAARGLACTLRRTVGDPPRPPFISDYTWNHTTLWAIRSEPAMTYLQAGFGVNFREQFAALHRRFPGEVLLHLEWVAGNSKMMRGDSSAPPPGEVVVGGIPLVKFRTEERLREIIAYCGELGVFIANPHTYLLEEGGRHPNIADKRAFKAEVDPHALLNPGKMKTYPINPFAEARVEA